jgi:penicillin amidase
MRDFARCRATIIRQRAGSPRPTRTIFPPIGRATAFPLSRSAIPIATSGSPMCSRRSRHSLADSVALQHDTLSTPATQLVALLPAHPRRPPKPALAMLRGWDARLDADSGRRGALRDAVARARQADARRDRARSRPRAGDRDRALDPARPARQARRAAGRRSAVARDAMFDAALAAAWRPRARSSAPIPPPGAGHAAPGAHPHPLARIPAIAAAFPAIEGEGTGGDSYTVMARWLGSGPGLARRRRRELSPGDRRRRMGQFADAQLARPVERSALAALSRPVYAVDRRRMQPMLFSRAAVDAHVAGRTTLRPRPPRT